MQPSNATDHDLLILLSRDVTALRDTLHDALDQLKKGNERFVAISLRDQEIGAAIVDLRQNYSRAMLTADQAHVAIGKLHDEVTTFKTQLKTILWVAGPLIGIAVAVATEVIKKWFGL